MCSVALKAIEKELASTRREISVAEERLTFLRDQEKSLVRNREQELQPAEASLEDRLRAAISARDPEQLAFMSVVTLRQLINEPKETPYGDFVDAMKGLANGENPVVREMYFLETDGENDVLDEETVQDWKRHGVLIHPETGNEVRDPESVTAIAWYAIAPEPSAEDSPSGP